MWPTEKPLMGKSQNIHHCESRQRSLTTQLGEGQGGFGCNTEARGETSQLCWLSQHFEFENPGDRADWHVKAHRVCASKAEHHKQGIYDSLGSREWEGGQNMIVLCPCSHSLDSSESYILRLWCPSDFLRNKTNLIWPMCRWTVCLKISPNHPKTSCTTSSFILLSLLSSMYDPLCSLTQAWSTQHPSVESVKLGTINQNLIAPFTVIKAQKKAKMSSKKY